MAGQVNGNLGNLFEDVASRDPERPALVFNPSDSVTYGELDDAANRFARLLIEIGVEKGDVVCVFNTKTLEGFACMLGCLKIGAVYSNIDENNPAERLKKIFAACRPCLIVADSPPEPPQHEALKSMNLRLLDCSLEDVRNRLSVMDAFPISAAREVVGDDLAYIMFTSGSTGTPKGAVMTHANVIRFIGWSVSRFAVTPDDLLTNVNPIYFDNSVFDFYTALFSGAGLAPIRREVVSNPQALVDHVNGLGCTVWFSVPSLLIYLTAMKALTPDSFDAVRTFVFGGEGYPKSELKKLFNLYSHRSDFVNVYGPTECTCICSSYDITERDFEDISGLPPLGPISETFSYLVLDDNKIAENGKTGELCLMGPCVGLGYYNDPDRTRQSFCSSPLGGADKIMYRTGDLVRDVGGDEGVLFVGRKDYQIKHMGYRIEPEEIEAAINRISCVVQSAVIYKRIRESHGELVAFAAAEDGISERVIRDGLRAFLPDYMIPNRIEIMRDLPKNPNGKVDRDRLAQM